MPELEFLNNLVTPPIRVVARLTKSPKNFSRNIYLDPEDNQPFDVSDLNPLERGHVYHHLKTRVDSVTVRMPYRVMDKELAELLQKNRLFSFRACGDSVRVHRDRLASLKKMNSCLQEFTLSSKDFDTFVQIGTEQGFQFTSMAVEMDDFYKQCNSLSVFITEVNTALKELRDNSAAKTITLEEAMSGLREAESRVSTFKMAHKTLVKTMDRLTSEFNREGDKASASHRYTSCKQAFDQFMQTDLSRVYSEVVHSLSMQEGGATPGYLAGLDRELGRLKTYFPSLRHIQAEGDIAFLNLSGVKILLNPDSIRIEGDITALQPYTSGVEVSSKESRSRFSGIVFQEEP